MNKIRVLMCCSDLEYAKGGMVTVVENYLNYKHWETAEILFIPTHISGGKIRKSLYFVKSYWKIFWVLFRGKVDLAHLHMSERGSFFRKAWILRLCHLFGVPVIVHHHGAEFEDFYSRLSQKKKQYVKKILESAELNLVLCNYLVAPLKEKAPAAKVDVLYNAVSVPDENRYDGSERLLLFLGRIGQRKGAYDLLHVIKELDEELEPDIRLCLCGDGEEEEAAARIKELGIGHRMAKLGWVCGEEKEQILKNTMLNILPSYYEGLPMTILETMARGIPNISTRIAAIPEVIQDGKNGFLINPGDCQALRKNILELTEDKRLRGQISQAAYDTIKDEYSLDEHIRKLRIFYHSLVIHKA